MQGAAQVIGACRCFPTAAKCIYLSSAQSIAPLWFPPRLSTTSLMMRNAIKPNDPRTFTLILSMDNIAALLSHGLFCDKLTLLRGGVSRMSTITLLVVRRRVSEIGSAACGACGDRGCFTDYPCCLRPRQCLVCLGMLWSSNTLFSAMPASHCVWRVKHAAMLLGRITAVDHINMHHGLYLYHFILCQRRTRVRLPTAMCAIGAHVRFTSTCWKGAVLRLRLCVR